MSLPKLPGALFSDGLRLDAILKISLQLEKIFTLNTYANHSNRPKLKYKSWVLQVNAGTVVVFFKPASGHITLYGRTSVCSEDSTGHHSTDVVLLHYCIGHQE